MKRSASSRPAHDPVLPEVSQTFSEKVRRRIVRSPVFGLLPIGVKRRMLFRLAHGYALPGLPQTFSEKVQWRIINDRRPLIALAGDKLRMKEYAAEHCDRVHIPETLWVGDDLASIVDRDWGGRWVLKPISGSGFNVFGSGSLRSSGIALDEVRGWKFDKLRVRGEWAYSQARSGYLIERRIELPDGGVPDDLKLWVFGGRTRLIYMSTPRSIGERHRFYSPAWEPLPFHRAGVALADPAPAPEHLDEAISIANEIGAAYDFIRVDLYDTPEGLYFGELTPYPAAGLRRFAPIEADYEIGSWWALPALA